MARKKLSMRKTSEVARLRATGLSIRQIARSCRIARSTVSDYLARLDAACLSWPFPPELTEEALDARLFSGPDCRGPDLGRPVPEWAYIHKELHRRGVTKQLLWEEYLESYPDGTDILSSASTTGVGRKISMCACARCTGQVKSCSWTTPG